MSSLVAYHNKPELKADILTQLAVHREADEIVKGQYWTGGKGCAVGCTIHSGQHIEYESRFGIPVMLARLEDAIFEGLPNAAAQKWPERFMGAIQPGADLSRVGWAFLHWLLTDEAVNPGISHPLVKDAIAECADLICRLKNGQSVAARSAASAAWSAERSAESARSAAESAARSAASAAWSAESAARSAASAARSAAESAARSAASAAWSAESAARSAASAAWSAAWSAERSAAWSAARSAAYVAMADKLIELIEAAPDAAPAPQTEAAA